MRSCPDFFDAQRHLDKRRDARADLKNQSLTAIPSRHLGFGSSTSAFGGGNTGGSLFGSNTNTNNNASSSFGTGGGTCSNQSELRSSCSPVPSLRLFFIAPDRHPTRTLRQWPLLRRGHRSCATLFGRPIDGGFDSNEEPRGYPGA